MSRLSPLFESTIPNLASEGYEVKSPETRDTRYNCIAFAADSEIKYWWPSEDYDGYWPPTAPREETTSAFIKAFQTLDYEICDNEKMENGYEKIAIYVLSGRPTHAAKQCEDGKWKSKLGAWGEDIKHNTLKAVEDDFCYGHAEIFMKRKARHAKQPTS